MADWSGPPAVADEHWRRGTSPWSGHMVGTVPRSERGPIEEFKAITKYL